LPQLKHFQWYVAASVGQPTGSLRPQPGAGMPTRGVAPGVGVAMAWDRAAFPCAWQWWSLEMPGHPWHGRARMLAIEPATAWPGRGLAAAATLGTAHVIQPGEVRTAWLTMTVFAADANPVSASGGATASTRPESRAERARRLAYRNRFAGFYIALAIVAGAGVGALLVLVSRGSPAPAPAWSVQSTEPCQLDTSMPCSSRFTLREFIRMPPGPWADAPIREAS